MHVFAPLAIGRFQFTCLIFICSINVCISYISVIPTNFLESGILMLIGDNFALEGSNSFDLGVYGIGLGTTCGWTTHSHGRKCSST